MQKRSQSGTAAVLGRLARRCSRCHRATPMHRLERSWAMAPAGANPAGGAADVSCRSPFVFVLLVDQRHEMSEQQISVLCCMQPSKIQHS